MDTFLEAGITSVHIHFFYHPDIFLSPGEYADYMIEIFETWLYGYGEKIRIRLFESIFYVLMGLKPMECYPNCGKVLLSCEPNGDIWVCSLPFGCRDHRFGNIMQRDLGDIFNSRNYSRFLKLRSDLTNSCRPCRWYRFCYGDCTFFRTFKSGRVQHENPVCGGKKKIFEHVTARFDEVIEKNAREYPAYS